MQQQDGSKRYSPLILFIIVLIFYCALVSMSIPGGCGLPPPRAGQVAGDCNAIFQPFAALTGYYCATSFYTLLLIALAWAVPRPLEMSSERRYGRGALQLLTGFAMLLLLLGVFSDWAGLTFTPPPIMPYQPVPQQTYADHSHRIMFALSLIGAFVFLIWPARMIMKADASPEFLTHLRIDLPHAWRLFRVAVLLLAGVAIVGFALSQFYWPPIISELNNADYGPWPWSFVFFLAKTSSPDWFPLTKLDDGFMFYTLLMRALCYLVIILGMRLMAMDCAAREKRFVSWYPVALLLAVIFAVLSTIPAIPEFYARGIITV